ncbi:hypothetical protein AA313_de0201069 [Arthrobotrys entomopaga]|nr:hypothetical protein AA313_de0201069 [Arthrobotrys entomopaga]
MLSKIQLYIQWILRLLVFINLASALPVNENPLTTPISTPHSQNNNNTPNPYYIPKPNHKPRHPAPRPLEAKPQPLPPPQPPHYAAREGFLRVRCAPRSYVYSIPPSDVPGVIDIVDWPDWSSVVWNSMQEALGEITLRQRRCARHCRCTPEGRMIPRVPLVAGPGCHTQQLADQCRVVLACFCSAEIGDEDHDLAESDPLGVEAPTGMRTGQELGDFRHELGGIVGMDGRPEFSFSNGRVRVSDPRVKEPYFLEGPSKGETWDWLANLGALSGGLGRIVKRESSGQENGREVEMPEKELDEDSEEDKQKSDIESKE